MLFVSFCFICLSLFIWERCYMNKTYLVALIIYIRQLRPCLKNFFFFKLHIHNSKNAPCPDENVVVVPGPECISTDNMTIITVSKGFQFMLIDILKKFLSETHSQTFFVFVLPEMLLLCKWEAKNQQNIWFFTVLALLCKRGLCHFDGPSLPVVLNKRRKITLPQWWHNL